MTGATAAIARELHDAEAQMRPVVNVRVTTDALRGAITSAPVSPERARLTGKLMALPNGTVEAAYDGRALEILVHPADWYDVLKELPHENGFAVQIGEPNRVFDIPVVRA